MISTKQTGIGKLIKQLERDEKAIASAMTPALRKAGRIVQREWVSAVQGRFRSQNVKPAGFPHLRDTVVWVRQRGTEAAARVMPRSYWYAGAQEYGKTIRPRTKKRLVFAGRNGRLVSVPSITIPPRPFISGVASRSEPQIVQSVGADIGASFA